MRCITVATISVRPFVNPLIGNTGKPLSGEIHWDTDKIETLTPESLQQELHACIDSMFEKWTRKR